MEFGWYAIGAVLCLTYIIVGAIGNGLTVTIFFKNKKFRNPVGWFILSLAMQDFFTSIIVVPINTTYYLFDGKWVFDKNLCVVNKILSWSCISWSAITLCFIAINRFIKICHPVQLYQKIYTAGGVTAMIWFALIYPTVVFTLVALEIGGTYSIDLSAGYCRLDFKLISYIIILSTYIIMFLIIVYCYTKVYLVVLRSTRAIGHNAKDKVKNIRLLKMLIATTGAYLVCFLMPFTVDLLQGGLIDDPVELFFYQIPTWTSVVVNPIIYGTMNLEYRKAYLEVIPKCFLNMFWSCTTKSVESQPPDTTITQINSGKEIITSTVQSDQ